MGKINRRLFSVLFLIAWLLFLSSCSDNSTGPEEPGLTEDQQNVIEYFKEVALGFEFGNAPEITRKWNQDVVMYVGGEQNEMLQVELNEVITELNELISGENIEIRITADSSESNYYVFFGPGENYAEIESRAQSHVISNFGLFFVSLSGTNHITSGTMYVDTERPAPRNQRHLLREELTQSLGMAKDSNRYSDSIFNADYSVDVTEYSEYDKALIRLLYHPKISTGLDSTEVDPILREIVGEVIE